jgi:hypothetical protein
MMSALHDLRISELSRSPFGFGSDVSLSTLRPLCYRRERKTRYTVERVPPSVAGLAPARCAQLFPAHRPNPRKFREANFRLFLAKSFPITAVFGNVAYLNAGRNLLGRPLLTIMPSILFGKVDPYYQICWAALLSK